jgi:positive regulator of sigma E activity
MADKIELTVRIIHMTDEAALVTDDDTEKHWLPLSQVECEDELEIGDTVNIEIPEWLAIQEGLA